MNSLKVLYRIYESAEKITFDDSSKFVLISDCHRGDGSWSDNFARNRNLYIAALNHYYSKDYTYIELGDGDELWENRNFSDIVSVHADAFKLLGKFYNKNRLYIIYGNHDIVKEGNGFYGEIFCNSFYENDKNRSLLFEKIKVHEGLVLRHKTTGHKIFLVHGHQVDYMNSNLWKLSRFLIRYLWRPLELFGITNPTSPAKNHDKKDSVDKRLIEWVKRENQMLVAGHTHRPVFPDVGKPPYFNDGSCVHPHCITAIEITCGHIVLVKWEIKTKNDGTLFAGRDIIEGPKKLADYYKKASAHNGNFSITLSK